MMRRRTMGLGTGLAPVRMSDIFVVSGVDTAQQPTCPSRVQPRQLDFNVSTSSGLNANKCLSTDKPNVTVASARRSTVQTTTDHVSVKSTSTAPKQFTKPSNIGRASNVSVSSRNDKTGSLNSTSKSGSQGACAAKFESVRGAVKSGTVMKSRNVMKQGSSQKKANVTRIPRINIHLAGESSSCLNSTMKFEEEELNAIISNPEAHHETLEASNVPSTSSSDISAEHVKLLLEDNRKLMQVFHLSFVKMNALIDEIKELKSSQKELNSTIQHLVAKVFNGSEPMVSVQAASAKDSNEKLSETSAVLVEKMGSKSVLSPTPEDVEVEDEEVENKENRKNPRAKLLSSTFYSDLRAQVKCLKTPTLNKAAIPETPISILSNSVSCQLQNLFESSEENNVSVEY